MKKIITGLLAGLFLFVITRTLAYLLGLDAIAQRVAHDVLQVPTSELYLVAWLLSGFVGLIALVLWLIFNVDERLSNILSPRPTIGSLVVAGDPTVKFATNKSTGKSDAELFVDLLNKNDGLISVQYVLKATVNGKGLDQPITGETFVSPNEKTRLFVRLEDVPTADELLAHLEYEAVYSFKGTRTKTRRTAKGIEWKARKPKGKFGPKGGEMAMNVTVHHYKQAED